MSTGEDDQPFYMPDPALFGLEERRVPECPDTVALVGEPIRVPGTNDDAILRQLNLGPQRVAEVARALAIDDGALHIRLHQMTAEGLLTWDGSRFEITDKGRAGA